MAAAGHGRSAFRGGGWVFAAAAACAAAAGSAGCAAVGGDAAGPDAAAASASPAVAYAAGLPIREAELLVSLREASGREVLEELVLGRLIDARLEARGVALAPADLEAERVRLLRALGGDDEDLGQRLLGGLRERRGLGPVRFERLLRRNAGLRRLVEDRVEVSEAAVRRAFDRSHGERFRLRLLTADTPAAADALRARVLAGEAFAAVAAEASTDASRDRGGLLDPVHPDDPTFPAAIRTAAAGLPPGGVSGVIDPGGGSGYAVLRLEEVLPADGAVYEQERADLERAVRADLERLRMDQLARTLRAEADVLVLDPALQP